MKFTKMQGAGNDYIYVDCTKKLLKNPSKTAIKVSERHFGIGSDGMILIKSSDKADFFMEMYNADGSQGKMCGNGIRCVGKYVYDNKLTDKTTVKVDTLSGVKTLELKLGDDGKVESVKVDMGAPILEAEKVPVNTAVLKPADGETAVINQPLVVDRIRTRYLFPYGRLRFADLCFRKRIGLYVLYSFFLRQWFSLFCSYTL